MGLGMIPYGFTVTSHIIVTWALIPIIFIGINIIGIKAHGLHMLSLFLPPGAPLIMAPLLVFIEIVSYSFRVVSFAIIGLELGIAFLQAYVFTLLLCVYLNDAI